HYPTPVLLAGCLTPPAAPAATTHSAHLAPPAARRYAGEHSKTQRLAWLDLPPGPTSWPASQSALCHPPGYRHWLMHGWPISQPEAPCPVASSSLPRRSFPGCAVAATRTPGGSSAPWPPPAE